MSIIFTTPGGINESALRMAYNNDVVSFYSNTITSPPAYADIVAAGLSLRLYPAPDNSFFINLKTYVSALINSRRFADTTQPDIDDNDADSFVYDFTNGSLLELPIIITVELQDETTETATHTLAWLGGVQQIADYIPMLKADTYILTPFKRLTQNNYFIKYWQGYPFDISLYTPAAALTFENTTLLQDAVFNAPGKVFRLFFSDGRTDETIEDILPLADGYNKIRVYDPAIENGTSKYLTLFKEPVKCGVYFKWLNKFGGYSYWLFENTAGVDRAGKSLGELDNDNENLGTAFNRSLQIGQQTQDTVKVTTDILSPDERDIVEGIMDSPKIYMFTGQPMARNGVNDWIEVTLKTNAATIRNYKQQFTTLALNFDLPIRYTQTL